MRRGLFLFGVLFCVAAHAHDADLIYAQVERAPGSRQVKQLLTMTAATVQLLAPVDMDGDGILTDAELSARSDSIKAGIWDSLPISAGAVGCGLMSHQAKLRDAYLELRGVFDCGEGELVQTFRLLSVLPPNYKVVLGTFVNGEAGARFAQGNAQTLVLDEPEGGQVSGLWGWVALGIDHIFGGLDHLAFLFALLLAAKGLKRVLLLVTSFTLAHSLSLGLTASGVIPLSGANERWVEVAIAASIIWVAAENTLVGVARRRALFSIAGLQSLAVTSQEVTAPKYRVLLTFAFGLVHGFGFASSLRGYGIERELVTALFGFNLGVELGQAAVVLAVTPVLFLLRRRPKIWALFPRLASLLIVVAGGYWLVARVVG